MNNYSQEGTDKVSNLLLDRNIMLTCLRQLIVWIIAVALLGQALGFSQPAQAIPLHIESLASANVLTLIDSNSYKTLGKDHEDASLATEARNKDSSVKEIVFSDTDQFYQELTVAVKSGEPVNIITDYTSYSDFPPRLKKIFKIDADSIDLTKAERHLLNPLGSTPSAAPILLPLEGVIAGLASIPAKLDYKWLMIPTCTAFGAGVGGAIGLPAGGIGSVPGALVGGAVGLTACSVTVAVMDNKHIVKIEIDPIRGTLAIVIMPLS